jgi:hypothetical protein
MIKIYRPVLTNRRSQAFGEARACAYAPGGRVQRPFKIRDKTGKTCPVGYVDFYKSVLGQSGHNGEDWSTWYKEPVYFPVDAGGETTWVGTTEIDGDGGIGCNVYSKRPITFDTLPPKTGPEARALWKINGGKLRVMFRFWHGQRNVDILDVKFGSHIQYADSTGASSGNHLHFAMKFVDAKGRTLDKGNGYTGAVDHSVFMENKFVLHELKERVKRQQMETVIVETAEIVAEIPTLPEQERPNLISHLRSLLQAILSALKS